MLQWPGQVRFLLTMGFGCLLVCLFDLILYVQSTIFQLKRNGSSWVEPVLSYDKCVLLKDHNAVTSLRLELAAPQSRVKPSTTEPLFSLGFGCISVLADKSISVDRCVKLFKWTWWFGMQVDWVVCTCSMDSMV